MSIDYSTRTYRYLSVWDPLKPQHMIPAIQVVSCFLQEGDKVLVLQRARKDAQHKLWGIPGGKLDKGEEPLEGLLREIFEETKQRLAPHVFQLLGTALSQTPSDGEYGLYIYHALVPEKTAVRINLEEHYSFRWVTLEEFQDLELLTAQREAFWLVEDKLTSIISSNDFKHRS